MQAFSRTLIALALATASLCVNAAEGGSGTRYKWKDAQGAVHFDDTLPAEALQTGYDVVDAQGMVVSHVDRPRTAAERKAETDAAAAATAARQHDEEIARNDQQLLLAYSNEAELAASQQGHIAAIDQSIKTVRASQVDQEKSLSEMTAHAATYEREGKPVPATIKQQIETLRKSIAEQTAYIAHKQVERVTTQRNAEAEMAHYKALRAKQGH